MLIFWAVLGGFLLDALFGDPAWLPPKTFARRATPYSP